MQTYITNLILLRDNLPTGAFFVSPDQETTLGRAPENTVVLNDNRCSRLHARIRSDGDRWFLCDMDSRNGTAINDSIIKGEVLITNGDRIQIGHQVLIFCMTPVYSDDDEEGSLQIERKKYSLAVSDTLAAAATHFYAQRDLTERLDKAQSENRFLRSLLEQQESEIVGNGAAMQQVLNLIKRVAPSKATVLIRGESGVGKELVARAIHANSPRRKSAMICLNCAAISESLLESELFGHEKGAFTGATERKIGKFEAANGGTLFLDEIAEMSPVLQAKFLRVLEGQPFERVGGNKQIITDVRVIAATNRDLEAEVAAGHFRHDLFFRLRVLEILVPPLRKHPEDIPLLSIFFLDRFAKETKRHISGFLPEAQEVLFNYRWPGNVRELKNVIERAVLLCDTDRIRPEDLFLSSLKTTGNTKFIDLNQQQNESDLPAAPSFVPVTLEEMEKDLISKTLDYFLWNKSHTAKSLGIERTTLDRKIAKYNIRKNSGESE